MLLFLLFHRQLLLSEGKHKFADGCMQKEALLFGNVAEAFYPPKHPMSMDTDDPPVKHESCRSVIPASVPAADLSLPLPENKLLLLQPGRGIWETVPAKFILLGPSYPKPCAIHSHGEEQCQRRDEG